MFTIHQQQSENNAILTLENASKSSKVVISLHEGARVLELMLASKTIIKEIPNFNYKDSYASSILFPFASRIENGIYEFEYKKHQLDCNQAGINAPEYNGSDWRRWPLGKKVTQESFIMRWNNWRLVQNCAL